MENRLVLYCDGMRSKKHWGWVVTDSEGVVIKYHVGKENRNSVYAELEGILHAFHLSVRGSVVFTDSLIWYRNIVGLSYRSGIKFDRRRHHQKQLLDAVRLLKYKNIYLRWIPRDQNKAGMVIDRIYAAVTAKKMAISDSEKHDNEVPEPIQDVRTIDRDRGNKNRYAPVIRAILWACIGFLAFTWYLLMR